jgi:5-methylcytosine-specific restriction enzyme A
MPWSQQSHRSVPTDWNSRKRAVRRRDNGVCHVCGHPGADQVDHLVNVASGGTHDLANLGMVHGGYCLTCKRRCHIEKTQAEAARARAAQRATAKHPTERHPGLV